MELILERIAKRNTYTIGRLIVTRDWYLSQMVPVTEICLE